MVTVTVHEAKTRLSELLRRVEAGEEIVIARGDKPVAVLKSVDGKEIERRRANGMGSMAGMFPPASDEALFTALSEQEIGMWTHPDDPALSPPPAGRKRRARGSRS